MLSGYRGHKMAIAAEQRRRNAKAQRRALAPNCPSAKPGWRGNYAAAGKVLYRYAL